MAMALALQLQAGVGESTGSVVDDAMLLLQNGQISDELVRQALKVVKDYLDAPIAEFGQLDMQWCEPASSRQITDLFDSADDNATSLVARAALGFGDMWWKGLSFMDLMYVKLSTAISSLAEHLEQCTLEIENLDGEVEQQMELFKFKISDVRREPVNGVCDNLSQLGYNLDSLNQMVTRMKGKIMKSDEKQDPANPGLWHLCNKADGHKIPGKAQGPKALADNSFPEDGSIKFDDQPSWLTNYQRVVTRRNTVMKQFLKDTKDNAQSCNRTITCIELILSCPVNES